MVFNSYQFLVFFPIVVFLYYVMPQKMKKRWLLVASYYFYMCWDARHIVLLFFTTLVTYIGALLIQRINLGTWEMKRKTGYKRLVAFVSIGLNLIVLFGFKYMNFAVNALHELLRMVHVEWDFFWSDSVSLPVGISFYTFQALGYIVDVYREEIDAEKNFFQYALFVSFFPQLVAGPIERSKNLLRQIAVTEKFKLGIAVNDMGIFSQVSYRGQGCDFCGCHIWESYTVWWFLSSGCYDIFCDSDLL